MDSQSIVSGHTKPRSRFLSAKSLLYMTRSSAEGRFKLRKLGRKLKAHFKSRPLSSSSFHIPPQELRNAKSVVSLRPVRDLKLHHVSEPTPVPSVRHRSVRFSHPAVRRVISALPTPLSTAGYSIPNPSRQYDSPANVDFPGQANASTFHSRHSNITNTVLFEEIFDQLDGVLAHPRDSQLLQRREEKKLYNSEHRNTVVVEHNASTKDKPWPMGGICGTNSDNLPTKSSLRALHYLSFHPPIREEAFSDEEIFATVEMDRSREEHVQATLDQLSIPREEIELSHGPARTPDLPASKFDQETSTRLPYLAFHSSFQSKLSNIPEFQATEDSIGGHVLRSKFQGKQPVDRSSQHNNEWEQALRTVQERDRTSGVASRVVPPTPDFAPTKTTSLKRRTLQQSTALDLYLATPAVGLNTSVTPRFPVLNPERELRRRTIIGEQQRDLTLTPGFTLKTSGALPRTFSIPRRGVGQASKPQAVSGLPLLSSRTGAGEPSSSSSSSSSCDVTTSSSSPSTAFAAHITTTERRRIPSFGSDQTLESDFPMRPKHSRLAMLRKIVTKNY